MIFLEPDDFGPGVERLLLGAETQASVLPAHRPETGFLSAIPDAVLADVAAQELRRRASRSPHLPAGILGEAGWHILLELFVSEQDERRVSLSSACMASRVPSATSVRYIAFLIANGLVERFEDEACMMRTAIRLTSRGRSATRAALQEYATDVDPIIGH